MADICEFVTGFVVGGLAGMFVMAMAASASSADRRTREIMDKEETDNDS